MVHYLVSNFFTITQKTVKNYILIRFNASLFFRDPLFSKNIGWIRKINYKDETIGVEHNNLYNPNNISSFNTKTHFVMMNTNSILKNDIIEMLKFNNKIDNEELLN